MSSADYGGPAFPVSTSDGQSGHQDGPGTWQCPGMSLRDYFAAQLAPTMIRMIADRLHSPDVGQTPAQCAAKAAYELADAMLEARQP